MNSRRQFIITLVPATVALGAATRALAADPVKVDENDPAAKGLGYKHDGSKVAAAKGNNCKGCVLYQGKAADAWGACGLFAGKQVAAAGWCTAWNKKA